ncbi:MAG: hypothetical protein ACKOXF_06015 [Chitinophagaceae bacterium]
MGIKRSLLLLTIFASASTVFSLPPARHLYPIVWQWMRGNSDSLYRFNNTTHPGVTDNLKDAYQVRRAREFWYQKNMATFQNGQRQWLGVTDFLGRYQTLRGVWRSGLDMVEQTLGGFTVHITPVNKDSIEITIHDIKSRWSLFLHLPFIKNVPHNNHDKKNMMNSHWIFTWREPILNSLFHQRLYNSSFYRKRMFTGHHF